MRRRDWLALRVLGAVVACGMAVGGVAFALRGDDQAGSARSAPQPPIAPTRSAPDEPSPAPTRAIATTVTVAPPPSTRSTAPTATGTSSPSTMVPVSAPNPTPATLVVSSGPDIPRYTDVAVLALAADALVPSGKTFRECVELPHEKWPVPVHLYYEGKGRWLVETHVSEVQVVFDEATGTFTPRNFQPLNPDCR